MQSVSLFFIPQGLEQLLYQHVLVLHSVRNSASVLKQLKCKLRKVWHLMKDFCVQYMVPKWVLDVWCFKNTYLIPNILPLLQISSKHCGSISKEELLLKSYEVIAVVLLQTHFYDDAHGKINSNWAAGTTALRISLLPCSTHVFLYPLFFHLVLNLQAPMRVAVSVKFL